MRYEARLLPQFFVSSILLFPFPFYAVASIFYIFSGVSSEMHSSMHPVITEIRLALLAHIRNHGAEQDNI